MKVSIFDNPTEAELRDGFLWLRDRTAVDPRGFLAKHLRIVEATAEERRALEAAGFHLRLREPGRGEKGRRNRECDMRSNEFGRMTLKE